MKIVSSEPLVFALLVVVTALVLAISSVLDQGSTTRYERVDTLASGPYIVAKDGLYLAWANDGTGLAPHFRRVWTGSLVEAWHYADRASALSECAEIGGVALSLRSVL